MYREEAVRGCIFVKRLNRFVATVIIQESGKEVDVHVKNTGRCKELLVPGSIGYVVKSENPNRKYEYDLVLIYKGDSLVNFDSQIPNKVVTDYIAGGNLFTNITLVKREVTYKNSRFDIYVERLNEKNQVEKIFIEVKGVTLFEGDAASFPDAPTVRGTKHVGELAECINDGYKAYIFFLVQTEGVKTFSPNHEIDPSFSESLKKASTKGVNVLCYNTKVSKTNLIIKEQVEVKI